MNTEKYHLSLRILHWVMALIILALIASGWYMHHLDNSVPYKFDLYALHKSFGVMILILFFVRGLTRLLTLVPALPGSISTAERHLAHSVHAFLYISMLLVPLSGYIMSDAGGYGVKLFGLPMPHLFNGEGLAYLAHTFHHYSAYVLLAFIGLHVAGAVKHQWFDKPRKNILSRML